MKLSINRILFPAIALLTAACSNELPAQPQEPSTRETIAVQEPAPTVTEQPAAKTSAKAEQSAVQVPVPAVRPASSELSLQEIINRLKQWDQKLRFLTTSFTQTTAYDGVQISRSQGTLSYDKANHLLRLDTLNDDGNLEQSAITDKKSIIILDESGKTVTTLAWDEWQRGQPNQALFDFGNYTNLLDRHQVKLSAKNQLALTPKEGETYTLFVTLAETDYFPVSLKIVSDLLVTQADLKNIQKNNPLKTEVFGGFFK